MNITNHLKAESWNFKRHPKCNFTIPEEKEFVNRYKDGEAFSDMAEEAGVSRGSLWKMVTQVYDVEPYQTVGYPVKYDLNTTIFSDIDNEKSMYALGLIYSDGHISKFHSAIQFKSTDKEQILNFRKCFETTKDYYTVDTEDQYKDAFTFQVGYEPMVNDLLELVPKRSKDTEKISDKIASSPYFHHFLRGFLDGDGSVRKTDGGVEFTGKKSLMKNLRRIIKYKYGLEASSLKRVTGGFAGYESTSYHLSYYKNKAKRRLQTELYDDATLFLTRKRENLDSFLDK